MPTEPTLRVLSLGAGVQSSVMALMAAKGEIGPAIDFAVFADTGAEPQGVYDWLDTLEDIVSNPLRVDHHFPIYRVAKGNLHDDIITAVKEKHGRLGQPPFFMEGGGMLWRKCTKNYKIVAVEQAIRKHWGLKKGQRVPKGHLAEQWIGISCDEAVRMKPSRHKWSVHRFPLIEENMHRHHCLSWMKKHDYPEPAKSACTFCPYHDNAMWRDMKLNDPTSFAKAVEIDEVIRDGFQATENGRKMYVHSSCKPLDEVDFRNLEDKGQLNMFNNECEGMCGV